MSAMHGTGMARARSDRCLFRRRLISRSDVKRTQCACRSQNWQLARSDRCLFRCRLISRSDVKRTQCACRSQNRSLLRGGRS